MAVLRDKIVIKNLSKTFASKKNSVEVLKDINLTVKENEFLVILGPGQCGKTVLLNILAELDEQTSGTVEFADGRPGFEKALPKQLSGGMKQRVGIARAYASESDIMLMDEPFGALDAQTRYSMEDEILKIWEKNKRTVIFVTNNVEEAIYLGDRIILLGGHPTSVKKEYIPEMPRPRNYTDQAFLRLRNEIVADTDLSL